MTLQTLSDRTFVGAFVNKVYTAISKRLSEKVHATIPKDIVVGFEITVLHRNFKRMAREPMDYVSEC